MIKSCLHCGEDTKNLVEDFCCLGCAAAYKIIGGLGLENYYKLRQINQNERKIKPEISEEIDISEFIIPQKDGTNSISLMVQGLHCAACIWLIESILKKQKNVVKARINLSQKTLFLSWDGEVKYGNDLVHIIHEVGYKLLPFDAEILQITEKKYNDSILRALAVAGFGAGNLMLLSVCLWFSDSSEMGDATRNLLQFFSALIALPVIIFAARPFFSSAWKSTKAGYPNMDLAISIAIFLACLVSMLEMFRAAKHVYFDSAVMLIFFLLIGRYLDLRARKKAFSVATEFSLLSASFGRVEENGRIKILPPKQLKTGMILILAAGEKIAADGIIIDGESEINTATITGESLPRLVRIGAEVFAGMINLSAPLKIRITKSAENSLLSEIVKISSEVELKKNHYIRMADKLAKFYTPAVHLLAFITFCFWFKSGWELALMNATAVLIITCPCALALAVPIVQTIAISKLLQRGILVKSGEALEKLLTAQAIVFDKTGSVTIGLPRLLDIEFISGEKISAEQKKNYLMLAASLAKNSKHPISQAISAAYDGKLEELSVQENQGLGLVSAFQNQIIKLGRREFCEIMLRQTQQENSTVTMGLSKGDLRLKCFMKFGNDELVFFFEDEIKSDAKSVISKLKQLGKRVILLSGDSENLVKNVADELGISEFYFAQTPLSKMKFLEKLKAEKYKIIMVGDGLNDAPSLALADVSISFSRASDIAQNIADIVIQGEKLSPIITLINSTKKALSLMKENLLIALIYNLIALPFAVSGYVVPLIAALAMSSSSLLVLFNSLRMNKGHLEKS